MNNRVNYSFVGLIVLIGFIALLLTAYWMLKPAYKDENKNYVIYFDESVYGLNIDAPVKFRGISVGKVSNLRINPHNSEQVEVQVQILKETPIKENIVAVLTAQGITGLAYINLTVGKSYIQHSVEIYGDDYVVIATAPSLFQNVQKSLGNVSENVTTTLLQTQKLLNDQNQEDFMKLVTASTHTIERLGKALDDNTIKHFQNSMANLDSAIEKVDYLVDNTIKWEDNVSASLYGVWVSYKKIDATMTKFKAVIEDGQFNFQDISSDLVPNINESLLQLQTTMIKFDEVLQQYDRNPSDILLKRTEMRKGPGEK